MNAHVLLDLLNELRKRDKMRGFYATRVNNSIINVRKCKALSAI